ncbi:DNA recombination protein RmuC [Orrella sp. 11846]|uniref:DNA recombination protein RmuC n=1 Tax=Orrella sp. 11846 TaxID=3409913 RepID=UPI003B591145
MSIAPETLDQWLQAHGLLSGLLLLIVILCLLVWLMVRSGRHSSQEADAQEMLLKLDGLLQNQSRLEQSLRLELGQSQTQLRHEISEQQRAFRQESTVGLEQLIDSFSQRLSLLTQTSEGRFQDLRDTVEKRLEKIQQDNRQQLEQMRQTVDEKLQASLEKRLSESFQQVSQRLEAVHQGLGEMQALAQGVGDLKRVLTNVKSRGTWGEVQMMRLVEDVLTPAQYALNVKTVPTSSAMVELAIRLPGVDPDSGPVWLPVDAKFPKEEYERLQQALDAGDQEAQLASTNGLRRAIEAQGKLIAEKYLAPPHTTDFAIMFLPSESLYAEVLRLPGMLERLQAMRIVVAGPVNFAALLSSLQMGFKTLAIEQRSSEVWQILRGVKTEFDKFGVTLTRMRKSLETAANTLSDTEQRTRVMLRTLKDVEILETDPHAIEIQEPDDESATT